MKVFEIITETQQLNEFGEGALVRLLSLAGINLVERAAVRAATERLVAKYAAEIATASRSGGTFTMPTEAVMRVTLKAEGLSDDAIAKVMKNPAKFLQTIEKEAAAAARKASLEAGKAQVRMASAEAIRLFGKGWQWAYGLANLYGYGEPLVTCVTNVMDIYSKHEAGEGKFKDPQYAKDAIQFHIDKCVAQMAGLFAGTKILKGGFAMIRDYPWQSGAKMTALWNGASAASRMAFVAYMNTDEGRTAYSEWLLGETFLAQGFKWITEFMSDIATTGANKLVRALHPSPLNAPNEPAPNQAYSKPSTTQRDPLSGRALNEGLARRLR